MRLFVIRTFFAGLILILGLMAGDTYAGVPARQDKPLSPIHYTISDDGTSATILLDKDSADAVKDLVNQLTQTGNLGSVKAVVYAPQGQVPVLILTGTKSDVENRLVFIRQFLPDLRRKHLVVISAALRELSEDDALNIGLTVTPDLTGMTTTGSQAAMAAATGKKPALSSLAQLNMDQPVSNILQFNEIMNRGRVLVSSDVYTPNGIKASITNLQQVPIFSTDNNGNVMTQYQPLETSITVLPTTLDYREEEPHKSQVRVDVTVKVSIITSERTFKATTAPEYSTKNYSTTRVVTADNQTYIVGSFVTDQNYKTQVGVPFLSKIPILKYFFSREETNRQRGAAILTLSVRLLPIQNTVLDPAMHPLESLKKTTDSESGK